MTEDKFNEQCRIQISNLWYVHSRYEARKFDVWLKHYANDLRLIAKNMDDLIEVYEMENKVK